MASAGTQLRALVTGGATNIGRAITECLVRDGAAVVVGQPDPSVAAALVARHPGRVTAVAYDQGRPEDCRRLVATAVETLGGLDVLVNNAALSGAGAGGAFLDLDDAAIDRILAVNLRGVIQLSVAAGRIMRAQGTGGVIVHISSINALRPQLNASVYAATKAALSNLAQSMAKELAPHHIRVVAVAPGDIWTDTYEKLLQELKAKGLQSDVAGQTPLGQGQPSDIGEMVAFLVSSRARYVTGTTVVVDGGLLA